DDDDEDMDGDMDDDDDSSDAAMIAPITHTSGDSLDDGLMIDGANYGIDDADDDDSIEDVSFSKKGRRGKKDTSVTATTRKARKMDLGIAIQDVEQLIANESVYDKLRAICKTSIPYAFPEFPPSYNAFSTQLFDAIQTVFTSI